MKLLKRTLLVLVILLVLSAGSVFVVVTFYKKELTQVLTEELILRYGLTLLVEDVNVSFKDNWPRISVQLINVSVASERHHKTSKPFLRASSMSVSFNFVKLLQKQFVIKHISLEGVDLNLIKYADGTKNFDIIKSKDTLASTSKLDLNLNKLLLKNVHFNFIHEERGQKIGLQFTDCKLLLKNFEDGLTINMKGEVLIKGLLFNPRAGEFLTNTKVNLNIDAAYFNNKKSICVLPPSYVDIENHRYGLCSIIELSEIKRLYLVIESKNVSSDKVATYLTPKIKKVLSNFKMNQTLDARFLLVARLGLREEPVILADIIGKDCDLKIGNSKIPFSNIYFKGRVLSLHQNRQRGDMDHAKIVFESIKGKIYDFPLKADLKILDLPRPKIDLQASIVVDGKNIKKELSKGIIMKGTGLVSVLYSGSASNLTKERFLDDSMYLKAYLVFTNLSYKNTDTKMEYVLNGKATLDKNYLNFENLRLTGLIGDLMLKGRAEGFMNYLLGISNILKAKVEARSQIIDLNKLYIQNPTNKVKKKSDFMDRSQFDIDLQVLSSKLLFRKIEGHRAEINLNYKKDLITISHLNLKSCDGDISVKGSIKNMNKINTTVSIKNVDATQLFSQFENFGQEAVKSENIQGKIFLEGTFSADLDHEKQFIGKSLVSDISVKIKDGHLINFEPLQNISNLVLKQRDVKDVRFSEINENLKIRGFEIKLDEMEIASSILDLYVVNGLYNLKGHSNINMLIPWSNIKKMGSDYVPKGSGQSAENTRGLKLNYSGPPQKMKLSLGHKEQEKRFW